MQRRIGNDFGQKSSVKALYIKNTALKTIIEDV